MTQYSEFGPFAVLWDPATSGALFAPLLADGVIASPEDRPVLTVETRMITERIAEPAGPEAFFFGRVRAFVHPAGITLADGTSRAVVSRDGHIVFELHPDSLVPGSPFATHGAPGMLAIAARYAGVFHMHGAVVTWRELPTLVVGQGHAGKTTTALSLIASGGSWAGDDLALFRPSPAGVECWGVARRFHLRPATAALFPEITRHGRATVVRREQRVDVSLEAVIPERRIRGSVVPKLVLMPQIVDTPITRAESVDPVTALGPLLQASAMIVADELGRQQDQLSALGALMGHCHPVALYLGRDGLEDPLAPAKALGRWFDATF